MNEFYLAYGVPTHIFLIEQVHNTDEFVGWVMWEFFYMKMLAGVMTFPYRW